MNQLRILDGPEITIVLVYGRSKAVVDILRVKCNNRLLTEGFEV